MIYFRGCVIREKLDNISKATETILNIADVDYSILKDEGCCGSPLLRTGFYKDAVDLMLDNLDKIKDDKILTSCAGCYRTLKYDYSKILDVKLDVTHSSQLFCNLIEDEKLEIRRIQKKATYHDPCHLGRIANQRFAKSQRTAARHSGEYDAPRNILNKMTNLVEMKKNKEKSRCCGAGGGVKAAFPEIAQEVAKMRLDDVENTKADIMVATCPFCILNLNSAFLKKKRVIDLSELIIMGIENE